jgi:hypothetical protein
MAIIGPIIHFGTISAYQSAAGGCRRQPILARLCGERRWRAKARGESERSARLEEPASRCASNEMTMHSLSGPRQPRYVGWAGARRRPTKLRRNVAKPTRARANAGKGPHLAAPWVSRRSERSGKTAVGWGQSSAPEFVVRKRQKGRHLRDHHGRRLGKRRQDGSANRRASGRLGLACVVSVARMMIAMSRGRHFGAGRHFHADVACLSRRYAQTRGHKDRKQNRQHLSNRPKRHGAEDYDGKPLQNKAL